MSDRMQLPGKFVWFELETREVEKAQAFYAAVLGWRAVPFRMGAASYDMIFTGETPDTMIGGYAAPARAGAPSRWIAYASVIDVDATLATAAARGGRVVQPATDVPGVGRRGRLADPEGAELCVITRAMGDPPDRLAAPHGAFFWNELHARDAAGALAFYEAVLGFTHQTMQNPGGGGYHVLSRGGVGRAGVTGLAPQDPAAYWLPYAAADDVDAAVARARRGGAAVRVEPQEIPDVGRFAVIADPTGASLAIMKPNPHM